MQTRELTVGTGSDARDIRILVRPGNTPGLFWLGGFMSDMTGTKAAAFDAYGGARGLAVTRFDYSGHGQSGGAFVDGTISRWLAEALAVFATTKGPQIVAGSSMGGWLAMLLNRALRARGEDRVAGLLLIAPAIDMTEDLMRAKFTPADLAELARKGRVEQPSDYGPDPYILTRDLIADGADHLLFGDPVLATGCPVAILQGAADPDVPLAHTLKLASRLVHDPASLTIVPGGDHRLSQPQDLATMERLLDNLIAETALSPN